MRVVFAGTPDFSVPVLQALIDADCDVVGVYCQPDRPSGRGRKLQAGPVKSLALSEGYSVFQPLSLKNPQDQQTLKDLKPDLMVVVAYGLLLPQAVLDIPRLGCVNLHASLLPRWRGAAPIQRAIVAGDKQTGVCLMQMEAGLDTGPVLASADCAITDQDTGGTLHDRLSVLSAQLLKENLSALNQQTLTAVAQNDELATYAHKLDKKESLIDWTKTAEEIDRQVRGFNPWPVAATSWSDKPLRIWKSEPLAVPGDAKPGTVVRESKDGIDVVCGSGQLRLTEIQLPGAKRLAVRDFLNANSLNNAILGNT